MEVERLNGVLRSKLDEVSTLNTSIKKISEQNQYYLTQVETLQREASQLSQHRGRLSELELELREEKELRSRLHMENSKLGPQMEQSEQKIITLTG